MSNPVDEPTLAHVLVVDKRLRALAIWFWRKTTTQQETIADELGVGGDLDHIAQPGRQREILRRVRVEGKIEDLARMAGL